MNVPAGPSRLGAARRRAGLAKRAVAVSSAAAFAVALVLARASHPAAPLVVEPLCDAACPTGSAPTVQSNGS